MIYKFDKNQLKKSYNYYKCIYRLERTQKGKDRWKEFSLDKKTIDAMEKYVIDPNSEYRLYPYKYYFFRKIGWWILTLWDRIKNYESKLTKLRKNSYIIIIIAISTYFIKCCDFQSKNTEYEQQSKQKIFEQNQTILNYEILKDSLEIEIMKMELKEIRNQQVLKKYKEKILIDSLMLSKKK